MKQPFVVRNVGHQRRLNGMIDIGVGIGFGPINPAALGLGRCTGKVDLHILPLNGHGGLHGEGLVNAIHLDPL